MSIAASTHQPAIAAHGLRKVYRVRGQADVVALDDVSLALKRGEIVGLLGANGAGKTTTIKCLCGLVTPTAGDVTVGHLSFERQTRAAASRLSVVLEGNRNIYWRMSVRENVEFFAGLNGVGRETARLHCDSLITRFGLAEKISTPARMLSRGMQQKLSLVCALARQTDIILLDEPTLGLDVETSRELRRYFFELKAEGRAILLSSHDMRVVQDVSDRVVVLSGGRVVAADTIPNLVGLFRAQAYEFVVDRLTEDQRSALRARFPLLRFSGDGGSLDDSEKLHVEFADDGGIYDLIRVLQDGGTVIRSIERQEPNLEDVYVKLIEGARS